MRTCLVCRRSLSPSRLVNLTQQQGRVLVHKPARRAGASGRGAHVCVARDCLEQLTTAVLARAFRCAILPLDTQAFLNDLHDIAKKSVLDCVGLARRMGILSVGVDTVAQACAQQGAYEGSRGTCLVANDLAPRAYASLRGVAVFVSAQQIGAAAGMGRVGAVAIRSGTVAQRAAYWLAVWYETACPPDVGAGVEANAATRREQGFFTEVA